MSKQRSKELFKWYGIIALNNLVELKEKNKIDNFKECKTRKDLSYYLLNVFIAYYGLRCTCDDIMDWKFSHASGHYHHCDLYKFCHLINRCLDWSEDNYKFEDNKINEAFEDVVNDTNKK